MYTKPCMGKLINIDKVRKAKIRAKDLRIYNMLKICYNQIPKAIKSVKKAKKVFNLEEYRKHDNDSNSDN